MTRIIAGTAGGRRLRTPPGAATRPTSDRVREALFSTLESAFGSLHGCRFLDLYAGSGAIGLEAVSRGAAHATLVEHDRRTAALIRTNADDLAMGAETAVVSAKVGTFAAGEPAEPYDVVFLDPPYDVATEVVQEVVAAVTTPAWWAADGCVVVERSARGAFAWPPSVDPYRKKRYGETVLWYGFCHA